MDSVPRHNENYQRGLEHFQRENWREAWAEFDGVVKSDAAHAASLSGRGRCARRLGREAEATADLSRALDLDPFDKAAAAELAELLESKAFQEVSGQVDVASALRSLAEAFRRQGDGFRAIELCTRLLDTNPNDGRARKTRAMIYTAMGAEGAAIDDYASGHREMEEDAEYLNGYAWLLATTSETELRDYPKAVKLAEEACELTMGRNWSCLATLAVAYAAVGKFDRAVKCGERALQQAPEEKKAEQEQRLRLFKNDMSYEPA
jgi:tetratricopeptide (TPR) repeat protein